MPPCSILLVVDRCPFNLSLSRLVGNLHSSASSMCSPEEDEPLVAKFKILKNISNIYMEN